MNESHDRNVQYPAGQPAGPPALTGQVEALLRQGSQALETGDRLVARSFLTRVTRLDPTNQKAWLYLSEVAEDVGDVRRCLETVVAIDEASNYGKMARLGLTRLLALEPSSREREFLPVDSPVDPSSSEATEAIEATEAPAAPAVGGRTGMERRGHLPQQTGGPRSLALELAQRVMENRRKGIAAMERGEHERAIWYFTQVLRDFPTDQESAQFLQTARKKYQEQQRTSSGGWRMVRIFLMVVAILMMGMVVLLLMSGQV